jgi:hypothetical protein
VNGVILVPHLITEIQYGDVGASLYWIINLLTQYSTVGVQAGEGGGGGDAKGMSWDNNNGKK